MSGERANNGRNGNTGKAKVIAAILGLLALVMGFIIINSQEDKKSPLENISDKTVNGIHVKTGFIVDEGMNTVISHCTACHSS
jgi:hypothetical protein